MSKLLSTLTAGAFALVLSGFAFAQQDQPAGGQQPSTQQQQQGAQPGADNPEYQAALKKCADLAGGEKQKCIDAAKKKHGQM